MGERKDGGRKHSFDDLHDRVWQIVPAAWVIAKSRSPELRTADVEDIQTLPGESDGVMIVVKIKTTSRGEVTIRGKVLPTGGFELSQPENMEGLGSIFDGQADEQFASVIERAVSKR